VNSIFLQGNIRLITTAGEALNLKRHEVAVATTAGEKTCNGKKLMVRRANSEVASHNRLKWCHPHNNRSLFLSCNWFFVSSFTWFSWIFPRWDKCSSDSTFGSLVPPCDVNQGCIPKLNWINGGAQGLNFRICPQLNNIMCVWFLIHYLRKCILRTYTFHV